jgi:hypothetical protein
VDEEIAVIVVSKVEAEAAALPDEERNDPLLVERAGGQGEKGAQQTAYL